MDRFTNGELDAMLQAIVHAMKQNLFPVTPALAIAKAKLIAQRQAQS